MLIQDEQGCLFQTGTRRDQLGEDVLASTTFFKHAAQATDLAFDPGKTVQKFLVFVRRCLSGGGISRNCVSHLLTPYTLEGYACNTN